MKRVGTVSQSIRSQVNVRQSGQPATPPVMDQYGLDLSVCDDEGARQARRRISSARRRYRASPRRRFGRRRAVEAVEARHPGQPGREFDPALAERGFQSRRIRLTNAGLNRRRNYSMQTGLDEIGAGCDKLFGGRWQRLCAAGGPVELSGVELNAALAQGGFDSADAPAGALLLATGGGRSARVYPLRCAARSPSSLASAGAERLVGRERSAGSKSIPRRRSSASLLRCAW